MDSSGVRYEAFMPHHTPSKHRVMAVTAGPSEHTQLRAVATFTDAAVARRLADALNSQLLDRPNHADRLAAALNGLPDSIIAAVEQLRIDPDDAHHRSPLAAHFTSQPIDGILLFRTQACTPGTCTACTDCANDCANCESCDPEYPCELCLPPDLTPRTAEVLAIAGELLADGCYDAVELSHEPEPLPKVFWTQGDDFIRRMARCFDDLAADLFDGERPRLHDLAEQLALHLMIDEAERLHIDEPDFISEYTKLLPSTRYDYEFSTLYESLFEDGDHIDYLEYEDNPLVSENLHVLFDPFRDDRVRNPNRGYRRQ